MKLILRYVTLVALLISVNANYMIAQQDTSSYFPLGLWGIWLTGGQNSPHPPDSLPPTSQAWIDEKSNFNNIRSNYLVAWIPQTFNNQLMDYSETAGYKLDVNLTNHYNCSLYDYSFPRLITCLRVNEPPGCVSCSNRQFDQRWKDTVDARINYIKATYGGNPGRPGFYSYFVAHEADLWGGSCGTGCNISDTTHWKGLKYVIDRIKALDPKHKSYVVHWGSRGAPPFPYGITVSQFADSFPNLGVYQVDDYVFLQTVQKTYTDQQPALGILLTTYNDCMIAFRDKSTEWHAVIQSQRELDQNLVPVLRRPTREELKVQAYLALSRGARGITAYVYGTKVPSSVILSPDDNPPLGKGLPNAAAIAWQHGLVTEQGERLPYDENRDDENIDAFGNMASLNEELRLLGPTIRKLRVYDAFPNTAIPGGNIADISNVSGDNGDKIEIGVFKRVDQGQDSTVYFMLVNRVCVNPSGGVTPQNVTTTFSFDQSKLITEIVSGQAWVVAPSNGSFTVTLDPGSGKLFKIEQASIGSRDFPQGLTVQSGATLSVGVGSTLTFGSGKSLLCYGVLSASGTAIERITFTGSGASGTWGGLVLSGTGANGSRMEYVNIDRVSTVSGSAVSVIGVADVVIRNCSISNNVGAGTNALFLSFAGSPEIGLNTFNNNPGTGVYFGNTNGVFYGNVVKYNAYAGVRCSDYSSPAFALSTFPAYLGNNTLKGSIYGVYASTYCYPLVGLTTKPWFGYNDIDSTSGARVFARISSNVLAQRNWWGSASPNPGWFVADPSSSINWTQYLTSDPTPGMRPGESPKGGGEELTLLDGPGRIRAAMELRAGGQREEAKILLREILSSDPTSEEATQAGVALLYLYRDVPDRDIYDFVQRIWQQHRRTDPVFSLLVAKLLSQEGRISEAAALYTAVATNNRNTQHEKSALLDLFYVYFTNQNLLASAQSVLAELQARFANDDDVMQAAWLCGLGRGSVSQPSGPLARTGEAEQAPDEFALRQNYPNPFNPSTQINFDLPVAGAVSLTIYDVLGRRVAELASEYREAGSHSVTWNAGAQLASGVYLARFAVANEEGRQLYAKNMKMMLMK